MSSQRQPASDLLPLLVAAYPLTFFADPKQVQPLKIDIHQDLYAALPAGVGHRQVQRFLYWYVNRAAYQRALLHGRGRIDLTGAMVDDDIPAAIREQARERWQQIQAVRNNAQSANPTRIRPSAKPGPCAAAPALAPTLDLEDLYAMAVDAKLEVILKFSTLPNAKPAGSGKMAFALKTPDGQYVTAEVGSKVWNQLVKAAQEWPGWIAALSGTMGEHTEKGFALANPGLQIFEKKAKAAEAIPPLVDTPPVPVAPAEPVAPAKPAAPVTVTTGAGTATVTVTRRAPLSLKRNAAS